MLILIQGLFLENVEFEEVVKTFFKTSLDLLILKIEAHDTYEQKGNPSKPPMINEDSEFDFTLRITKQNLKILKRAIDLQKRINKIADECFKRDNDHWKMQHIRHAIEGIHKLMKGEFPLGSGPIWSPLSYVNSNEHIKQLKYYNLPNLAIEFIKWRMECAKNREDHLFGHEMQYQMELINLYLDMKKWSAAKSIINKNLNMAKEETPPNENWISFGLKDWKITTIKKKMMILRRLSRSLKHKIQPKPKIG